MTTCNMSDLFVFTVTVSSFIEPEGPWQVTIKVDNLGIETLFFDQSLEKAFACDRGVAIQGKLLTFVSGAETDNLQKFCDKKANELLDILKKHPLWDKPGSPDKTREYSLHE